MSVVPFSSTSNGFYLGSGQEGPDFNNEIDSQCEQYETLGRGLQLGILASSEIENIKNNFQKLDKVFATAAKITMIAVIIIAANVVAMLPVIDIPAIIFTAVYSLIAYDMHITSKNIKGSLAKFSQLNSLGYLGEEGSVFAIVDRQTESLRETVRVINIIERERKSVFRNTIWLRHLHLV